MPSAEASGACVFVSRTVAVTNLLVAGSYPRTESPTRTSSMRSVVPSLMAICVPLTKQPPPQHGKTGQVPPQPFVPPQQAPVHWGVHPQTFAVPLPPHVW